MGSGFGASRLPSQPLSTSAKAHPSAITVTVIMPHGDRAAAGPIAARLPCTAGLVWTIDIDLAAVFRIDLGHLNRIAGTQP